MNKYFFIFLTILCGMLTVGCSSDSDGEDNNNSNNNSNNEPPVEIALSRSQQDIVDAEARFAFDFFKQTSVWAGNEKNMVISPLSLSIDLAMLANGAGEKTYQDIAAALHLPNATVDELNEVYEKLVGEMLSADRKVELSIANGMWSDNSVSIKDGFANAIKKHYTADIQSLDFSDRAGSMNTMNRWASEKTNGKISNLYNDENDLNDVKLVLCNALSFKGEWTSPFDKKGTQQWGFTNIDASESIVGMMFNADSKHIYSYASTESAEIVSLPYGNRSFSMYVMLPSVGDADTPYEQIYESFIENIDYDWWTESKEQMTNENRLAVCLPKFKIETKCPMIGVTCLYELNDVVFNPDMSMMTDANINCLRLDQHTSIEVAEAGTVAASVSKGEIMSSSPGGTLMLINRPFIFLIEESSTGAILFMGKVTKL
ncbi:MAG: serpin family protein [Bacteroides sp.]|nr:serpin family protein [Bacteroides sp.]